MSDHFDYDEQQELRRLESSTERSETVTFLRENPVIAVFGVIATAVAVFLAITVLSEAGEGGVPPAGRATVTQAPAVIAAPRTDDRDVTVEVEGSFRLSYSGNIRNGTEGRSVSGSIVGRNANEYTISGKDSYGIYIVVFQKSDADGRLTVTLHCPRGLPKTGTTSAAYGIVQLSCPVR